MSIKKRFSLVVPRDLVDWASLALIVSMILLGALVIYWVHIDGNPELGNAPIIVNNDPVPVVDELPVYYPGENIVFHWDVCRNTREPADLTRTWLIGTRFITSEKPVAPGGREKTCEAFDVTITIPSDILPGVYHIEWGATYQINPLNVSSVSWTSQEFTVHNFD